MPSDRAMPACPMCGRNWKIPEWTPFWGQQVCGFCVNSFLLRRAIAYLFDAGLWGGACGTGMAMLLETLFQSGWALNYLGVYPVGPCFLTATTWWPGYLVTGLLTNRVDVLALWTCVNVAFLLKDAVGGVSPGKWLMGLRVVDRRTLEPATWQQSLRRNWILLVPGYIGHIAVAATLSRRARAGEQNAGTMVIWHRHRFSPVFTGRHVCRACGYDLTANTSGRCPECGTQIQAFCRTCGYDLTGNVSGRCPECGCATAT